MLRQAPDRGYRENLRGLDIDRANSDVLDSRVRLWCDKLGLDPAVRYIALEHGHSISFVTKQGGRTITLHRIRPEELE